MENKIEVPRRNRLDLNTPAELSITKAIQEVELLGADMRLTEIVVGLSEIKSKLSDYIDSQEVEEELPKKGQIVWVRNYDSDKWSISHFLFKENGRYCTDDSNDINFYMKWEQITTKNPYEVEEDREPEIGDMVYAWDDKKPNYVICGILHGIYPMGNLPYAIYGKGCHKYCSLKNPLIK